MKRCYKTFIYTRIILVFLCLVASSPVLGQQWPDPVQYKHDGWITTNWHQGDMAAISHYNRYCPTNPFETLPPPFPPDEPKRFFVGCVATALAQIVNYWQYPSSVFFDDLDRYDYTVWGLRFGLPWEKIHIDEDHDKRDFPSFDILNYELDEISYSGDEDEEAYLCFAAGVKLGPKQASSLRLPRGGADDFTGT